MNYIYLSVSKFKICMFCSSEIQICTLTLILGVLSTSCLANGRIYSAGKYPTTPLHDPYNQSAIEETLCLCFNGSQTFQVILSCPNLCLASGQLSDIFC